MIMEILKKKKAIIQILLFLRTGSNSRKRAKLLKKWKVFHSYGDGGLYQPFDLPSEPQLVSIGNNVSIAANVRFKTHDIIQSMFRDMNDENYPAGTNRFYMGKIEIYDNCVIGANSTILYDTKIGPNALVAAGSVVTRDVPPDMIVGGNPAVVIGSLSKLAKKRAIECNDRPYNRDDLEAINKYFWENGISKELQ